MNARHLYCLAVGFIALSLSFWSFLLPSQAAAPPPGTVQLLLQELRSSDPHVRRAAARALASSKFVHCVGPKTLVGLLLHEDIEVRWAIQGGIKRQGIKAVPALIALLDDCKVAGEGREAVVVTLGLLGNDAEKAIPALVRELGNAMPRYSGSTYAMHVLRELGTVTVPALLATLSSQNAHQRKLAVRILGEMDPSSKESVPALVRVLQDQDRDVRLAAIRALEAISPQDNTAVLVLESFCRSSDDELRIAATSALVSIGPPARYALHRLIRLTRDSNPDVRALAACGLELSGTTKDILPYLLPLLQDKAASVRSAVAVILGRMGKAALPAAASLRRVLADDDPVVRLHASRALLLMTPNDQRPIRILHTFLQSRDQDLRAEAAKALGDIRATDEETLRGLSRAVEDESTYVVLAAALALGQLGPHAHSSVPFLTRAMSRADDDSVTIICGGAVLKIAPNNQIARSKLRDYLPSLVQLLRLPNETNQVLHNLAADILVLLGSDAQGAIPELEKATMDKAPKIRNRAKEVLKKIKLAIVEKDT